MYYNSLIIILLLLLLLFLDGTAYVDTIRVQKRPSELNYTSNPDHKMFSKPPAIYMKRTVLISNLQGSTSDC